MQQFFVGKHAYTAEQVIALKKKYKVKTLLELEKAISKEMTAKDEAAAGKKPKKDETKVKPVSKMKKDDVLKEIVAKAALKEIVISDEEKTELLKKTQKDMVAYYEDDSNFVNEELQNEEGSDEGDDLPEDPDPETEDNFDDSNEDEKTNDNQQ